MLYEYCLNFFVLVLYEIVPFSPFCRYKRLKTNGQDHLVKFVVVGILFEKLIFWLKFMEYCGWGDVNYGWLVMAKNDKALNALCFINSRHCWSLQSFFSKLFP